MLYWVNQYAITPDQPGGTRHFEMSRELVRQGLPTTVVASDLNLASRRYTRRRGPTDRRYLTQGVDGVEFAWLPAGGYQANDWRRAFSMLVFATHVLWFLLRAPMPRGSVIVGSTPHLPGAAAARLAALLRRRPFVLEVRDLWPESLAVGGDSRGAMWYALRLLAVVLYRTSRTIIVLAVGNRASIAARGVPTDRIHYLPNGVDPSAFETADPAPLSAVPVETKPFVYAGAHGPANGLDTVLDSAAELRERGERRPSFVLIGDGPAKEELEASATARGLDNVIFIDPVPKSEIPGIMKACTGALMPLADVDVFTYGVSPNKLFDYLCAGLPVVTNVPGDVARIVSEANGGIVVPPRDPVAMADAVVEVLENPGRFDGGLDFVRRAHDRTLLARKLHDLVSARAGGSR